MTKLKTLAVGVTMAIGFFVWLIRLIEVSGQNFQR